MNPAIACCRLYRTLDGAILERSGEFSRLAPFDWDELFRQPDPAAWILQREAIDAPASAPPADASAAHRQPGSLGGRGDLLPQPHGTDGRIASAGGGDFYDRVYSAPRPELFFKATPHRVVGPGQARPHPRRLAWNVPEPELTLACRSRGRIFGYTIGNDMSSRDIEGENPLYLPQAKVYDGCCALGPCMLLSPRSAARRPPRSRWRSAATVSGRLRGLDAARADETHRRRNWSSTCSATTVFPPAACC